jgi:hypothetical protein
VCEGEEKARCGETRRMKRKEHGKFILFFGPTFCMNGREEREREREREATNVESQRGCETWLSLVNN